MRKSSKMILGIFVILLLIFTAACASENSSSGTDNTSNTAENNTSENNTTENTNSDDNANTNEGETFTINIAHGNQPEEPVGQFAQKWKELAEEESGNQLQLELYPSSQLGPEKDVVEQATMGNNVIVLAGYDFLMDYVPDAGILTAPYLAEDFDDLLYLTTTDWFDDLRNDLREQNLEVITNIIYGERHLMTNEKVTTPEELEGMKIRVPDNPMSIETFEAMGAAATPTPLGDLYTSLQQGLVDGAENPLPVLEGVKAHEVSKYLALTGHQKFITSFVGGTDFIDTIPEDLVNILRETGDEAAEYARGVLEEETASVMEEFEAEGVEIYEIDTAPFEEKVQSVYDEFPEWTDGLYDTIQDLLENQ